ncbi:MAG: DUF4867 family protein [Clostridiales bacterium]|jgi:hypothetical protein|nr:DUF4867 family protein [Clostridiales bacterium]
MEIKSVMDASFLQYGKVLDGYDFSELIGKMESVSLPKDVVYVPSVPELEEGRAFIELQTMFFGGLPIQIGYCIGYNSLLNAVEYHRSSEINIAATDLSVLVGDQRDICLDSGNYSFDSKNIKAFSVKKGQAFEFYATTLHFAPCGEGFKAVVVLPRGTNTPLEAKTEISTEDKLLYAKNKWLIGHGDWAPKNNAYQGIIGGNVEI